ncbi:hypothetical protein [Lentzea sp.]|nr:hypothetical protein [Lentzea sp.]HUQ57736.1 hypothetical protein [Lentzea sp.]
MRNDSAASVDVAERFEKAGFLLTAAEAAAASGNRALFTRPACARISPNG